MSRPRHRMSLWQRILSALLMIVPPAACQARCTACAPQGSADWRTMADGLRYRFFRQAGVSFHAVRLDLSRMTLRVADARRSGREVADVQTFAAENQAVAAVNGTF